MITNYYERLVLYKIDELLEPSGKENDDDYIADIACIALNQLPARYVRHSVDTSFYMTAEEEEHVSAIIYSAVTNAIEFINKHRDNRPDGSAPKGGVEQ